MADTTNSGSNIDIKHRNRRELMKSGICASLALIGAGELSCCPGEKRSQKVKENYIDFSMVAYCCLECDKCDAFLVTQNNDDVLRAKVAKEWQTAS